MECYIRGYRVYKQIWNPKLDGAAIDVQERENSHKSHEATCCSVEQLQQAISQQCFFLLMVGGPIKAKITEP